MSSVLRPILLCASLCASGSLWAQSAQQTTHYQPTPEAAAALARVSSSPSAIPGLDGKWPEPGESPGAPDIPPPSDYPGSPIQNPTVPPNPTTPLARPPVVDQQEIARQWMNDPVQQPLQQGQVIPRPLHAGIAQSSAPQDRLRLEEWRRHLQNEGVPLSKINFEAARLSRADFELWASRQVWAEEAQHPNGVRVNP